MVIFYFIVLLLIPATMIVIGYVWKNHPPNTINCIYGYRTTMSMKNQDTWDFAHMQMSKYWPYLGWSMGIISMILLYMFRNYDLEKLSYAVIYITIFQTVGLLIPLPIVEYQLKKNFNKDGSRKNK